MKISGRAVAGIASGLIVLGGVALLLFGVGNLAGSRLPDGLYGAMASAWRAGEAASCRHCPDRLFVIVCDAASGAYLHSAGHMASLKAEFVEDPGAWARERGGRFPCIEKRSFRLASPSGRFGGPYDAADPGFRWEMSYQVLRDDAAGQTVEVRFMDNRPDIDDALFRYEVTGDTVRPLESRVRTRGHRIVAIAGTMALWVLLALCWALYFAIAGLRRWLARRRTREGG